MEFALELEVSLPCLGLKWANGLEKKVHAKEHRAIIKKGISQR